MDDAKREPMESDVNDQASVAWETNEQDIAKVHKEFEQASTGVTPEQQRDAFERTRRIGFDAVRRTLAERSLKDGGAFALVEADLLWYVDYPEELRDNAAADKAFAEDSAADGWVDAVVQYHTKRLRDAYEQQRALRRKEEKE